ncbi:hypothetical protein NDN08_005258 [Rhodosorus marinus]|uniref:Transmembrane protein 230 n=1 Tax=Rhodosorus marinus TaxID=101924 RepID=A0AAV8V119_9RHOD|nr:hypothetical protein NDN08_005258 [Rhodosorus marinus]
MDCFIAAGVARRSRGKRVLVSAKKKASSKKSGTGFGKEAPKKGAADEAKVDKVEQTSLEFTEPETDLKDFVPQGPTMRAYYEKTGRLMTENPEDTTLPEVVSQRMLRRMVWLFSTPFALGVVGFGVFFFAKTKYDVTFQPAVVAFSTLGMFGFALFGLTYGIMSASWDVEREGSFLGLDEVKTNFFRTVDALSRSRSSDEDSVALGQNIDDDNK